MSRRRKDFRFWRSFFFGIGILLVVYAIKFMNIDPGIVCFTHCHYSSIFCRVVPTACPLCQEELSSSPILPFRVPFPFVRANQNPCCILIKPSNGTFLECYSVNDTDLHIGITTSDGIVIEYDTTGVCKSKTNDWNQCLIIYELEEESWSARWDTVLSSTADKFSSSSTQYNANTLNCYTFVLSFVKFLNFFDLKASALTKEIFCQTWVVPRLRDACRYILLHREIEMKGVFVQNNN